MRRNRPAGFDMIGVDGWVSIPPGGMVALFDDFTPHPTQSGQIDTMRRVRGWVLGAGFATDNELVNINLLEEFGTIEAAIGGSAFQTKQERLRSNAKLGTLVDQSKFIFRRELLQAEADNLIQDHKEYVRLRNLMAHRPSWLEADYDASAGNDPTLPKGRTTGFRLYIADATFIWEIDQAQIIEWEALMLRCCSILENLRRRLMPSP